MGVKLGSGDVSFRLGAATPAKLAIGSSEVWTDVVPTEPGIPTGLTVTTSTEDESAVDVSWSAPESDGDSPITGYKVYSSLDDTTYTLDSSPSGTSATVIIPYAGGGTVYIKVSAVNAIGEGGQSAAVTGTLSDSPPSAPEGLSGAPQAGYDIALSWYGGPYASPSVTGHEVSYLRLGPGYYEVTALTGSGSPNYTIALDDESEGAEFEIRVRAINALGAGDWSEYAYVTAADVPEAPTFDSATTSPSAPGQIDIAWTAPEGDGGSAITSYGVEYDTNSDFSGASEVSQAAESTSAGISGLVGGESYYLRIRAINAAGGGAWAYLNPNEPVVASDTVPGVPANFAVVGNNGTVEWDATWTEPNDGGSEITQYDIQEQDEYFANAAIDITKSGTGSSYSWAVTVQAVRNFRIRAVNAVGAGDWSAWVVQGYDP